MVFLLVDFDLEMVFRMEKVIETVREAAKKSDIDGTDNGPYLNGIRVGEQLFAERLEKIIDGKDWRENHDARPKP